MVPALALWARLPQKQANATSLVAIIPIALAAIPIYYFRKGSPRIDFHIAILLIAGAIVGAFLGARLLKRIPDRHLRLGMAVLLVAFGVKEIVLP
jgi:uncharacterized membrane protein YfcA